MLNGRKICVVLPAYNAEATLIKTYQEIPLDVVDDVVLVDDRSSDRTSEIAQELGLHCIIHPVNRGYGGNQKTCYQEALARGGDIVVMVHPDYQYTPKLIVAMAAMIAYGEYDAVIGSRILAQNAIRRGMPPYKYFSNRVLTLAQNLLMGQKLSEYHTGFRAFSREILENLPLERNSDNFIFDNQMLAQILFFNFRLGEISCPTRYAADSSSIGLLSSIQYGLGVLRVSLEFFMTKRELASSDIFKSL